jgi:hypothetical protein
MLSTSLAILSFFIAFSSVVMALASLLGLGDVGPSPGGPSGLAILNRAGFNRGGYIQIGARDGCARAACSERLPRAEQWRYVAAVRIGSQGGGPSAATRRPAQTARAHREASAAAPRRDRSSPRSPATLFTWRRAARLEAPRPRARARPHCTAHAWTSPAVQRLSGSV